MKANTARVDVYSRVTDKIVADLSKGLRPWAKPWSGGYESACITPVRHCGTPYRGINILLLWSEATEKGYQASRWMTYRQGVELGGQVRQGEHGALVVYADTFRRIEQDESGEDVERDVPFMKGYTVFNVEQIDGLPERYYDRTRRPEIRMPLIQAAEDFFRATGAVVRHGGSNAYYAPGPDVIQMPFPEVFRDAESYAAVKAHELTHWTRHPDRLNRQFAVARYGDEAYAREELVAELGAAFLCATLRITPDVREDHATYIGAWLRVLKDDARAIFQAASHAQRAVDYLHALQERGSDDL